jgi:uncharacterized membrane protein
VAAPGAASDAPPRTRILGPRGLVLLTLAAAVLLGAYKTLQHWTFRTHAFDTGIYANVAWNVAHGRGFHSDVLGHSHLGEHISPVTALFAPVMWVWPSALPLLLAQAFAFALTLPALVLVFEALFEGLDRRPARAATGVLLALFVAYRPAIHALHFEFHPSTLGMPLVAIAILALHRRSGWGLWVSVGLLLTTKESALATVAGLGIYARTVLYVGLLALLLGMLPVLAPRALLAAAPTTLLNCTVAYEHQFSMRFQYDDHNVVFWIIAAAHGAAWLLPRVGTKGRRVAAACVVAFAAFLPWGGAVDAVRRLVPTARSRALLARLEPYAEAAPDVGIAATSGLAPHVGQRRRFVLLDRHPTRAGLRHGDLLLLSDALPELARDPAVRILRQYLRAEPRAEVVERDGLLEVYRWNAGR